MYKIIILLFTLSTQALAESKICEETYIDQDINCCISRKECTEKISTKVKKSFLQSIKDYKRVDFESYNKPNCYWAALNYSFGDTKFPSQFINGGASGEFEKKLKRHFREIRSHQAKPGDMVVFYTINDRIRVMAEDMRSKVWYKLKTSTEHAAIYIGDGKVIQKEDRLSSEFTISSIGQSLTYYRKIINSRNRQVSLQARYFTKK